jgi:hypothetical protein
MPLLPPVTRTTLGEVIAVVFFEFDEFFSSVSQF